MAAAPITVSDHRKSVVDFTTVIQEVSLTALVKAGSNLHSLEDLLESNMTFGDINGGNTAKALMGSRDPQISILWSRIVSQNGMVDTAEEGRKRAKNGDYAFILEKPIADYFVAQDCSLETAGDFFPLPGFAFPTAKNNPDLPNINRAIVELKKEGKIAALIDKWWAQQTCSASRGVILSTSLLLITLIFSLL